jgi:LysM repeat protein
MKIERKIMIALFGLGLSLATSAKPGAGISATSAEVAPTVAKNTPLNPMNLEFHVVEEGETPASVAGKYGISMEQLGKWNNLKVELSSGRILIVGTNANAHKSTSATASSKTDDKAVSDLMKIKGKLYHVVVVNETLYHLSVVYGVSVEKLKELNNLTDNKIKWGQKLIIKLDD